MKETRVRQIGDHEVEQLVAVEVRPDGADRVAVAPLNVVAIHPSLRADLAHGALIAAKQEVTLQPVVAHEQIDVTVEVIIGGCDGSAVGARQESHAPLRSA